MRQNFTPPMANDVFRKLVSYNSVNQKLSKAACPQEASTKTWSSMSDDSWFNVA